MFIDKEVIVRHDGKVVGRDTPDFDELALKFYDAVRGVK